jgi:aromatic-L-amino-acid/L-tryptophan decarboxylase
VLKLWISIQTFGTDAFRTAIDSCMDLALHAQRRVEESDELEVITPAKLGIICFRRRCTGDETAHEKTNSAILRALLDSGMAMISSTRVRGVFTLRFCVLNYRTTKEDIDIIIDWIRSCEV